jgi:hypothetical protein
MGVNLNLRVMEYQDLWDINEQLEGKRGNVNLSWGSGE